MLDQRYTSFECTYNLVNVVAPYQANITSSTVKGFCEVEELVNENDNYEYATLEHNYFVLDGSLNEFPDILILPFFSSVMSRDNGSFQVIPTINIAFDSPQSMYGLTLKFEHDYPTKMRTTITTDQGSVVRESIINNKTYKALFDIEKANSLKIEFIEALPNRYIKLNQIIFGQLFEFNEDIVENGSLTLENDVISDKISINNLTFNLGDKAQDFNFANPDGLHKYFQKRQPVKAYEWVNDNRIFLGEYFLNNVEVNDNIAKLNCVSYIGILDDIQFNKGDIYNGTLAGELIEQIFETANIDSINYDIDDETYNTPIYGTIKPMTCREALREVLFACQSTVNTYGTSEEVPIIISKISSIIDKTISREDKISTKVAKKEYTYGVEVKYKKYRLNNELEDIVKEEEYESGLNTIVFSDAYTDIIIKDSNDNTITPTEVGKYYVKFNLDFLSTITIRGKKYEETESTISVNERYLESGESETIQSYNTSLCDAKMAKSLANRILKYLEFRLNISVKFFADDLSMDGRKYVANANKDFNDYIAWYTKRNFDLTGGFVNDAELTGYYHIEYDYYYLGNEIYSGESVGII